jgi:Cu+-exporting ATPase
MDAPWFRWLSFGLAGVVQVLAGARFYRGAWRQLRAGGANMDTLVALGSTTAFAYSLSVLLSGRGGHLYFMESAGIITLISLGHWLEARAGARAASALEALLHLTPPRARRREAEGSETEVPVAALRVNDLVALRPGDAVPTDGEVVEGDSAVDESMLTGESRPVDKAPGATLYAGTVVLNGRLLMRVGAVGEATALAHIIVAVQRAQSSRASIQRLGDRVSSVFVPAVVLVAIAAGLWWGLAPHAAQQVHDWLAAWLWRAHLPETPLAAAFVSAAAVLIIACPCAMGLATPAAIMAGSNAAARRGILVRDGVALEKAGTLTAVVFDKTGTLTVGRPAVARFELAGADPPRPADPGAFEVKLAAALARPSSHPLSRAVAGLEGPESSTGTAGAEPGGQPRSDERSHGRQGTRPEVSDWEEVRGAGVQARWRHEGASRRVRLGSLQWLGASGVDLAASAGFLDRWSGLGASVLGLAVEQSLVGLVALQDAPKPGAATVVQQLLEQGLSVYLVTGDNARTTATLARQAGIPTANVRAEVRPEGKAEFVKELQARGERVAFVGDGINDAPALEQADLGIAVSRASDIAREAADVILLNSEIEAVPESLALARATLRTIRQNLFWAFFYNAVGVPLAALGFLSPVLCAAAMGASDLVVIGNAVRLARWKGRRAET